MRAAATQPSLESLNLAFSLLMVDKQGRQKIKMDKEPASTLPFTAYTRTSAAINKMMAFLESTKCSKCLCNLSRFSGVSIFPI